MSLNAKNYKQESKFKRPDPVEAGTYPARVVQIISLGLQKQNPYKGEAKDPKHMLYVTYEMLDEFLKDEDGNDIEDKPRWLSEDFTMNSLDSDLAKSTKRYLSLDPSMEYEGDWAQLAGAPCMITVIQRPSSKDKEKIFNNIASVSTMRPKEAAKAPDLKNPPKVFDIDNPDMEVFFSLPEWLQTRIKENLEYEGSMLETQIKTYKKTDKTQDKVKQNEEKTSNSPQDDDDEGSW
jgi:hypothetical protein